MSTMRLVLCAFAVLLASSVTHGGARQLGTRPPDAWIATLENPTRVAALKVDDVVSRLRLEPGSTVADIGAGAGAFEPALSAAVTPAGTVYAVDIEQGLLDHISARARVLGLSNVQVVLGKFTDPGLPTRNVHTALIYDVLHHITDRATYLKSLAGYLAPNGRIAVVDFIPGKGGHANDAEQQIALQQADAWMADAGLKPVEEFALFDDKWFVIYSK